MIIHALDPGNVQSAWVNYDAERKEILTFAIEPNPVVLERIRGGVILGADKLAVEMIASYGMPVGATVFDTCVWIGRFIEAWEARFKAPWEQIYRKDEKMVLCGTMKAKDSNIRQAIMDRYGSSREVAIGKKASPGPLYGVSKDVWAAIAVAITSAEMERLCV